MRTEETVAIERFIESLGEAALILEADGCVAAANSTAEILYNALSGELLGRPFESLCDEVDRPSVAHTLMSLNGASSRFTARVRRLDGSSFIGSFSAKRHETGDPEGRRIVVLGREAERRFDSCSGALELHQLMLEHSLDGIVAHTVEGELLFANHAAQAQWGMSADTVRARGAWGWVSKDNHDIIARRMSELMDRGEARFESHVTEPGGRMVHQEIHSRIVHTSSGVVVVSIVRDISERMQAEELVRYLAYHDTLTGLANRPMLNQELVQQMAAALRHGDLLGLIYIDLDSFKPINDTYGHATGDNVLRVVADRVSSCVREGDTVARLGGDEFVIVLPRLAHESDLETVAKKVCDEISRPIWIGMKEITVTGSSGATTYRPGDDVDSLLTRADFNMYGGRGRGSDDWGL